MRKYLKDLIIFRLFNLIRNRFIVGFNRPIESFGFLITVIPPLNILFALICKAASLEKKEGPITRIYSYFLSKGIGWGALRHISPETKEIIGTKLFKKKINKSFYEDKKVFEIFENLRTYGFSSMGILFESKEVSEALKYFKTMKYYEAQVPTQGSLKAKKGFLEKFTKFQSRYRSISRVDSLKCKQIKEFLKNPLFERLSKMQLGENTEVFSVGTFATLPGKSSHHVLKKHRDFDHFSSLTFFIAWTETSKEDGATIYYPKSHRISKTKMHPKSLNAKAGEVFVLDTFGFHSGNQLLKKIRVATWFRRGSVPNYATITTGNK